MGSDISLMVWFYVWIAAVILLLSVLLWALNLAELDQVIAKP